ncbi:MAG: 4Fe-4S binding protein [bacterium]
MKRKIINIDEEKCNGCEECIPNCPEGAIQIIDGKARLISDLFCDGLGACLGHCPEGAITVEEREAMPYDEKKVMENIIKQGTNVIKAHLEHLKEHGETELLSTALELLKERNIEISTEQYKKEGKMEGTGCPGAKIMDFSEKLAADCDETGKRVSQLRQWPIHMHLLSPRAPYFKGKDVLLAADCVAFALGDFHKDYLKGKQLAIACPKLDSGQEAYIEKIKTLVDESNINTLTVMVMQLPCCSGLLQIAKDGVAKASRNIPIKCVVVGIQGDILEESWV